jgi:hemolysin activation/secretion protein
MNGSAYWLTRTEIGKTIQGARPLLFTDIGWVGDRSRMGDVGRPMSGVGVGVGMMDGLIRFDVARGLYPLKQWRVDMYLEALF